MNGRAGQFVGDFGGNFRVDGAADKPVFFQFPQLFCEHFLGYGGEVAHQLAVSHRALFIKQAEYGGFPLAAYVFECDFGWVVKTCVRFFFVIFRRHRRLPLLRLPKGNLVTKKCVLFLHDYNPYSDF